MALLSYRNNVIRKCTSGLGIRTKPIALPTSTVCIGPLADALILGKAKMGRGTRVIEWTVIGEVR